MDCAIESAEVGAGGPLDYSCDHMAALELRQNGQAYERGYACATKRKPEMFKPRPHWSSKAWQMLDLGRVR